MSYADLTIKNRSFLKRFSHSRRFELALELLAVDRHDKIMDFGTGDGYMLTRLLAANPRLVVGYEPMESQYKQLQGTIGENSTGRVAISNNFSRSEPQEFNKVCCLEVLEHLTEENQCNALFAIKHVLHDQGFVVVSVPIEIGVSGLLKNFARLILRQQHPNTTAANIFKSFLGLKIHREHQPYISSHIGFDYRELERLFTSTGFEITNKLYSPLRGFGGFINSQVFFVLAKSKANLRSARTRDLPPK